jgi:hypothetical protein
MGILQPQQPWVVLGREEQRRRQVQLVGAESTRIFKDIVELTATYVVVQGSLQEEEELELELERRWQ